jgi:hypothetical protein
MWWFVVLSAVTWLSNSPYFWSSRRQYVILVTNDGNLVEHLGKIKLLFLIIANIMELFIMEGMQECHYVGVIFINATSCSGVLRCCKLKMAVRKQLAYANCLRTSIFNFITTGRAISRLTPLWGISRLIPLYPTHAPGSQYMVVGGVNQLMPHPVY